MTRSRIVTLQYIGIILIVPYILFWFIYLQNSIPPSLIFINDSDSLHNNLKATILHNFTQATISKNNAGIYMDNKNEEMIHSFNYKTKGIQNQIINEKIEPLVLKAYLNPKPSSEWYHQKPLPRSNITSVQLTIKAFPNAYNGQECSNIASPIQSFPIIDDYPDGDPYLPWIHDVFINQEGSKVHFIAQNRRRCHTGKDNVDLMKELEGQIALFQPVAVKRIVKGITSSIRMKEDDLMNRKGDQSFRLASYEDADPDGIETRFLCRFRVYQHGHEYSSYTTLSEYPFNYEYIAWRKGSDVMFSETGKDMEQFWLSNLQFDCPIPSSIDINDYDKSFQSQVYMDIIPIRTPTRRSFEQFFDNRHGGPMNFNAALSWGNDHILPQIIDSGRWENIRICPHRLPWIEDKEQSENLNKRIDESHLKNNQVIDNGSSSDKRFKLVACTWTSASHNRRGDARTVYDGKVRLKEWIAFHLLVGFDHIVVYDNTGGARKDDANETLKDVTDLFSSSEVTHVDFKCKICNNNRPAAPDPGERSSQYAAESSCRARFKDHTEWMAFFDPDEYFVPMGDHTNWKDILHNERASVLKFRSTTARPRLDLMVPTFDTVIKDCDKAKIEKSGKSPCVTRAKNETFLRTYNCEYIKSPKPSRFQRAMKQIYRPSYVLSHFVHYSTVNTDLAKTKAETKGAYSRKPSRIDNNERFVDEINEGVLVHAKTKTPDETVDRKSRCQLGKEGCAVGIPCHDEVQFKDETHKRGFLDNDGNYCNCWINKKLENVLLPQLEYKLHELKSKS